MASPDTTSAPIRTVADHQPAQAVIAEVLRIQSAAPPAARWRRVLGLSPLSAEAASWYQGALGELAVAGRLAQLDDRWTVLHAVPVGQGSCDIDHVVIGPAGVFTLNTKHHRGKRIWVADRNLRVNGRPEPYLPKATAEADRASRLLSRMVGEPVVVRGVLVVVGASAITVKEPPSDIAVVSDHQLVSWLRRQPTRLSATDIQSIVAVAENPATWQRTWVPQPDGHELRRQFDALRRSAARAQRRRLVWAGCFLLLLLTNLLLSLSSLLQALAKLF